MVAHILSYADAATSFVPNYGKVNALAFVTYLLGETYYRFTEERRSIDLHPLPSISIFGAFALIKSTQIAVCWLASPLTPRVRLQTMFVSMVLTSQWFFTMVANLGQVCGLKGISAIPLQTDRPSLAVFIECGKEVANIASKVIQSLAVGLIAQKTLTGQTEGEIRTVVTSALLALSALNVFYRVDENSFK